MPLGSNRLLDWKGLALLVVIGLLLSACGSQSSAPDTSGLAALRVTTEAFAAPSAGGDYSTLGVPTAADGSALITEVRVRVFDASGNGVAFDADNIYDPTGTPGEFVLRDSAPVLTLQLPVGDYTFESRGFDSDGTFLAYGETLHRVVPNGSVKLSMDSLLGDAALSVRPTSIHYVLTDQVLDVLLTVKAPGGEGTVPFDSFEATYSFSNGITATGELVGGDPHRGVRARVLEGSFDHFVLTATIAGKVADGLDVVDGSVSATLEIPVHAIVSASGDKAAPHVLTFDPPPALEAGSPVTLRGTADDDIGIGKIQVFEGPVLIGSSDTSESVGGVAPITFPDGLTGWTMEYTPTGNELDFTVIAFDTSGNQRSLTVEPLAATWPGTMSFGGGAIIDVATAADGSIYVVGNNMAASLGSGTVDIKKISRVGVVLWEAQLATVASSYGMAVTIDSAGDVIVSGAGIGSNPYPVAKYSSDGQLLQEATHRPTAFSSDNFGHAVVTDSNDNIYVVGSFYSNGYQMFVSKFDPDLNRVWFRSFASDIGSYGYAVAIDDSDVLYIGGTGAWPGLPDATRGDAILLRMDSDGEVVPGSVVQWGTAGLDVVYGIALDGGKVYVTGMLNGASGPITGQPRAFVAEVGDSGVVWEDILDTSRVSAQNASGNDAGRAITADGAGNLYVAGRIGGEFEGLPFAGGQYDSFLARYDLSGERQWLRMLGVAGHDEGRAVALESNGTIVFAGGPPASVAKFDADGDEQPE